MNKPIRLGLADIDGRLYTDNRPPTWRLNNPRSDKGVFGPSEFGSNPQGEAGERPALSRNCIAETGLSVRRSQVACPCSRPMPFAKKGEDP